MSRRLTVLCACGIALPTPYLPGLWIYGFSTSGACGGKCENIHVHAAWLTLRFSRGAIMRQRPDGCKRLVGSESASDPEHDQGF